MRVSQLLLVGIMAASIGAMVCCLIVGNAW